MKSNNIKIQTPVANNKDIQEQEKQAHLQKIFWDTVNTHPSISMSPEEIQNSKAYLEGLLEKMSKGIRI